MEWWKSVGMMTFPTECKRLNMFQTTNQTMSLFRREYHISGRFNAENDVLIYGMGCFDHENRPGDYVIILKKKVELVPKKLDGYYDRTYWDLKDHIDQVFHAHSQCPKLFELAICEIWAHLQMKNLTTLGLGFRAQLEHENPAWDACRFAQFFSTDSTPKPTFILTMQELTRTIIPFQGNEKKVQHHQAIWVLSCYCRLSNWLNQHPHLFVG